jgi:hypothetical protein
MWSFTLRKEHRSSLRLMLTWCVIMYYIVDSIKAMQATDSRQLWRKYQEYLNQRKKAEITREFRNIIKIIFKVRTLPLKFYRWLCRVSWNEWDTAYIRKQEIIHFGLKTKYEEITWDWCGRIIVICIIEIQVVKMKWIWIQTKNDDVKLL